MAVQPRLAAAVMLLRSVESGEPGQGIEVFMVRRARHNTFMPDLYVFPGGSVAADDRAVEERAGFCCPVTPTAADPEGKTRLGSGLRVAAIRELFEEANVLLAYREGKMLAIAEAATESFRAYRQQLNSGHGSLTDIVERERLILATDQLVYFAHWITPEGLPKRYDTHFFLAEAPAAQEAAYDRLETSEGVWIQPAVALTSFQEGTFPISFPTLRQLQDLAVFRSVEEALEMAREHVVLTHQPVMVEEGDGKAVYLPEQPEQRWPL